MVENNVFLSDPNSKVTWNHNEIRKWVEKHGGKPAVFDDPSAGADKLGIRIDFKSRENFKFMHDAVEVKEISWKKFFEIFDKRKLAFIYKDKDEPRDITMAYKLIPRKNI